MISFRPTPSALEIADRLERAGFEAWCVGGAIRDALLGGAPLDWDLATTARPEQVQALFGRKRTVPVGIEFGTVIVLDDANVPHEVTTFRKDVKTDGRHAVVEFGASLDDDLARRDFTINAIAWRPRTATLHDPFGGQADLAARVLRAVGDPDQRMREDRLRALRGIRFASRFHLTIDPPTRAAIERSASHLTRLSAERVQQELVKTMEQVQRPGQALALWQSSGALAVLVPALASVRMVTLETLDLLAASGAAGRSVPQRTVNRVAALFVDLSTSEVREALSALRFSRLQINWACELSERWSALNATMAAALIQARPTDAQVRRWLATLGRLHAGAFLRVALARWAAIRARGGPAPSPAAVRSLHRRMLRARFASALDLADLAVDGNALRRAGIPPGPIYAKILDAMLELVLDEPARNTPEALLAELPRLAARASAAAVPAVTLLTES